MTSALLACASEALACKALVKGSCKRLLYQARAYKAHAFKAALYNTENECRHPHDGSVKYFNKVFSIKYFR
jgi:hypothetical protein